MTREVRTSWGDKLALRWMFRLGRRKARRSAGPGGLCHQRFEIGYLPLGAAPLPVAPLPLLPDPAGEPEVEVFPLGVDCAVAIPALLARSAKARRAD